MKNRKATIMALTVCAVFFGQTYSAASLAEGGDDGMFMVRSTKKSPEAVADAVKAYSEKHKWQYIGANKVKNGEVTLVKTCIPAVGKLLWPLGLKVGAMLPCGNLAVYKKGDATEISMLNARYMQMIYPNPEVEKASKIAEPLLTEMLEAVAK